MSTYDAVQIEIKDSLSPQIEKKLLAIANAATKGANAIDSLQAAINNIGKKSDDLQMAQSLEQGALSSAKLSKALLQNQIASENLKAATARAESAQLRLNRTKENAVRTSSRVVNNLSAEERAYQQLEKRMESALKRKIALYSTESDSSYIEKRFELEGLKISPNSNASQLVKQLQDIERNVDRGKLTIGQYNNALRLLPAQFTDIATQLAGGQNPFLILLQQGGQMRDMFGGFGNMFKGLATTISIAKVSALALGGAFAFGAYQAYKGSEETRELNVALIKTHGALGITSDAAEKAAVNVGNMTESFSESRSAMLALIKSGSVQFGEFETVLAAVVKENKYLETSIEDAIKKYEEIEKDPYQAILSLAKGYKSLNYEVLENVKALVEQGDKSKAVALVQKLIADESQSMADRVAENLGYLDKLVIALSESYGMLKESIRSIGREATLDEQIKTIEDKIKSGFGVEVKGVFGETLSYSKLDNSQLAELQAQLANLKEQKALKQKQADDEKRQNELRLIGIEQERILNATKEAQLTTSQKLAKQAEEYNRNQKKLIEGAKTEEERLKFIKDAAEYNKIYNKNLAEALENEKKKTKEIKAQFKVNEQVLRLSKQLNLTGLEKKHNLPKNILAATMMQESGGKLNARSHAGASGLFQFMPATAREYGINPNNPIQAAEAAAKKLAGLLKMFNGSIVDATRAYNWGEGNVLNYKRGKRKSIPLEAKKYPHEVMARMNWLNGGKGEVETDIRKQFDDGYLKTIEHQQKISAEKSKTLSILDSEIKLLKDGAFISQSRLKYEEVKNKIIQAGGELTQKELQALRKQTELLEQLMFAQKVADIDSAHNKELQTLQAKTIEEKAFIKLLETEKQFADAKLRVDQNQLQMLFDKEKQHLKALKLQEFENELLTNSSSIYEDVLLKLEKINELKEQGRISEEQALIAQNKANSEILKNTIASGGNQEFDIESAALGGLYKVVENYQGATAEMTEAFGGFFTSVTDGFADATVKALIFGDSAKDALRQVAFNGAVTLTQELVKLGIRWALTKALGETLQKQASEQSTQVAQQTGQKIQSAYQGAAIAASVATQGQAAVVGGLAYIGAQLIGQAIGGMGSKARGGYTGNGGKYEPKGIYHGGEYIFDKESTNRIGVDTLEALRQGRMPNGHVVNVGNTPTGVNVVIQNFGTSKEFEVEQLSETEIRIIARDEAVKNVRSETPKIVAGELSNRNSQISKSLLNNFSVEVRR